MAMDTLVTERYLLDWDESDVHAWLSSLGLPQFERQIRENSIRGDSLCIIDAESLKSLGVHSIGQRLSILKAVYDLKLAQDIPIGEDDYVPPSQIIPAVSINDVYADVKAEDERLRALEGETRKIHDQMKSLLEDLAKFRSSISASSATQSQAQEKPAVKEPTYVQRDVEAIGRAALGNLVELPPRSHTPSSQCSSTSTTPPTSNTPGESPPVPETPETYKANRDDPTWKVLPAALRKHRIQTDDWPNYAMFISYGPRENRTKRMLAVNDKPFQLFSKLKEAKMNPAFVLTDMRAQRTPGGSPSPSHTP